MLNFGLDGSLYARSGAPLEFARDLFRGDRPGVVGVDIRTAGDG